MTNSIRPPTKDAILEAAFAVFSGDASASLSEVAERAGVGRATLHRHFSSRETLVRELARVAIEEMDEVVETACRNVASYSEAMRISLEVLIPLGDRHGFLAMEPIDDDPDLLAEFERQRKETEEMVEAVKREGLLDVSVPTAWIVQAYDHLLYAGWESVKAGQATPTQAADLAWRTLTTGLGAQS